MKRSMLIPAAATVIGFASAIAGTANPLPPIEGIEPFWPDGGSPRLATPQWIGESGIEAVVIVSIDDLRDPEKYEVFTRPIIDRLKKLRPDGTAAFSMMTNQVSADNARISQWLAEGVALESHTLTHPCPLLNGKGLEAARSDFFGCVDHLFAIPGNAPVAFRMPCCDSQNSNSPRFFAEILPKTSAAGTYVKADSSVVCVFSKADPKLPRTVTTDAAGRDRFLKYFPAESIPGRQLKLDRMGGFIENYPFPYDIGGTWEFPIVGPSDWQAWNFHVKREAPELLEDWKAALDATVQKQGVMTLCFHGHGWCSAAQLVALIDHAEQRHAGKVRFLTFREAVERLEKNALGGETLKRRDGSRGEARLLDLNGDGFMDVVAGKTRLWDTSAKSWRETPTPGSGQRLFFMPHPKMVSLFSGKAFWTLREGRWIEDPKLVRGLPLEGEKAIDSGSPSLYFRDFDRDDSDELLISNAERNEIWRWSEANNQWKLAPFQPDGWRLTNPDGGDRGVRFVDLNADGFDDLFISNESEIWIALWAKDVQPHLGWTAGWSQIVRQEKRPGGPRPNLPPPITIQGTNNGFWIRSGRAFWANESTEKESCAATVISFCDLIAFPMPAAKSPQEALAAFKVASGFTVDLAAAEPQVIDPVAFEWDAAGRLWVVEMRDYPLGIDGKGTPGGVVKRLEDRDGDGNYETATVFLDGLRFPTGVHPWRDGVLIAAAPDILFARDANDDGVCDERRILFTGFVEGNQQHRMNGFVFGLDGWLFGANGDSGGRVKALATATGAPPQMSESVNIRGRDFRFNPDKGVLETISGSTQYGLRRDDWGRWFGNNNPNWLWHVTLPEHYLTRNPKLAVSAVTHMLAQREQGNRVFPASAALPRFNQPETYGHVTSACSPAPYRDDLFGPINLTSVFICEPVHNVVHREILRDEGFGLASDRRENDSEFLASEDNWFRPVMTKTGPDGALYIADMVRFVLEHPEWISPEDRQRLDLRAGADKGRIWRVRANGTALRTIPNLSGLTGKTLAAAMDSRNGCLRDTVQRLLMEKHDAASTAELHRLVEATAWPQVKVQALATLDMLAENNAATVRQALLNPNPQVRCQALRSSEGLAAAHPEILIDVAALEVDPSEAVRRQLAFSLGAFQGHVKDRVLLQLAARDGADELMRQAILTSVASDSPLMAQLQPIKGKDAAVSLPKLDSAPNPDRAKVAAKYADAMKSLTGEPKRGAERFLANCSLCHQVNGVGRSAGPDLTMVNGKPIIWICTAVFDPNAAVEARYTTWLAKRKVGDPVAGIITTETANNLVLRSADGREVSVLRSDLADVLALGKSLMPEGLEGAITPQDLADILAWIKKPR